MTRLLTNPRISPEPESGRRIDFGEVHGFVFTVLEQAAQWENEIFERQFGVSLGEVRYCERLIARFASIPEHARTPECQAELDRAIARYNEKYRAIRT
jgi:hypothetical protein